MGCIHQVSSVGCMLRRGTQKTVDGGHVGDENHGLDETMRGRIIATEVFE